MKESRLRLGMSIQDLSNKIGAPYSAVYRWEKGINKPSPKYLISLHHLFNEERFEEKGAKINDLINKNKELLEKIKFLEEIKQLQKKKLIF